MKKFKTNVNQTVNKYDGTVIIVRFKYKL